MTTARKLWLGFGILTAVLVISSIAIIARVWSVDAQVRDMAKARNLSAMAGQLEISVLSHTLGVRVYLQTADQKALSETRNNAVAVEKHLAEYTSLATTPKQQEMAAQFASMWQELQVLSQALIDPDNPGLTLQQSQHFYALSSSLKKLLNESVQVDAAQSYSSRSDAALSDTRSVVHFTLILVLSSTLIAILTGLAVGRGVMRSERLLWNSREQARVTLASIDDAVITTDTHGRVTFLNAVAESLTGWSHEEAKGRPLDEVFKLLDRAAMDAADLAQSDAPQRAVLVDRTGVQRVIDDGVAPIRTLQGDVAGVVLSFRDVSERQRLEDELRRRADDLAESDRRKDEFLAMLAHELRNPLASISNALQIVQQTGDVPGAGKLRYSSSILERQVRQMVRLVDDLLDVSRISRGRIELRKTVIDIGPVARDAVEATQSVFALRSQQVSIDLPDQPVYVDADSVRLGQAIGNLLHNAGKFTPMGGHIALKVSAQGDSMMLTVTDNGIGIAPDKLPKLFDLFMQVDTSLGRSESGLGIGLTLVKELIELHGGSIGASSAGLGQGSEFRIELPRVVTLAEVTQTPASSADGSVDQPPAAMCILVVDDNEDSAQSMAVLLELDGHQTRIAADGMAALEMAESWKPDVILLDIGLPKLDGFQVARRIREQPWGAGMTLIAVTGWGKEEDRRNSRDAGFNGHLVKPASHVAILKIIAEAGANRRSTASTPNPAAGLPA